MAVRFYEMAAAHKRSCLRISCRILAISTLVKETLSTLTQWHLSHGLDGVSRSSIHVFQL